MDIYVMMSADLYGTCSSAGVIVMSHTNSNLLYRTKCRRNCNQFSNVATVASQLLSHRARCCIGCNRKYLNLGTLENFQTSENFRKIFFLSKFVFFIEVFSDNFFFKEFFIAFKTITLYLSDMNRDSLFYLNFTVKIQKCTNFTAFKTITLY